jgi:hypothetical protein
MNQLFSYRIKIRPFEDLGSIKVSKRTYFDFFIDNKPLSEILNTKEFDMIGAICKSKQIDYELLKIKEFTFQAKSKLEGERVIIYGCAECLDIGCGAFTAKIEKKEQSIIWRDFAYENGYEETDFDECKGIGPFEFEVNNYLNEFEKIKNEIEQSV